MAHRMEVAQQTSRLNANVEVLFYLASPSSSEEITPLLIGQE